MDHSYFSSGLYIIMWYIPNVATLLLNKYIYNVLKFTFPIALTSIHMLINSVGAFLVLHVFKLFPFQELQWDEIKQVAPLSLLFCLNILLGNISLRWVPVSFMQTVKSSVPLFTVVLQLMFFKASTRLSRNTYFSLAAIVGGVGVASYAEVNFQLIGFVAALVASALTALFALLSGRLLSTSLDSINLVFYMAPLSFFMMFPVSLFTEATFIIDYWEMFNQQHTFFVLFASATIAFLLNVTSFLVIKHTSPLTYTVAGNLKVVFSIVISVLIFQNQITLWNGIGCVTTLLGVMWYNKIRYDEHQLTTKLKLHSTEQITKPS